MNQTNTQITPFQFIYLTFLGVILLVGVIIAALLSQQPQDLRRAAAPAAAPATLTTYPESDLLPAGHSTSVALIADLDSTHIDGFQVVAKLWGNLIPADTFNQVAFEPRTFPGLELAHLSLVRVTGSQIEAYNQGYYLLKLAYVTADPSQPFSHSGPFTLGSFKLQQAAGSQMYLEFDPLATKLAETGTHLNLLLPPENRTFTFSELSRPSDNAVSWQTDFASLTATNFYMEIDNQIYTASQAADLVFTSSVPTADSRLLEISWTQHNRPMHLEFTLTQSGSSWSISQIRTLDNQLEPNWLTYQGSSPDVPLGDTFTSATFTRLNPETEPYFGLIVFENLSLTSFPSPAPSDIAFSLGVKFRGVNPATVDFIPARVELGYVGSGTPILSEVVNLTADSSGTFTRTLSFAAGQTNDPSQLYWIRVKGEKHLARLFSNLTITSGASLDLTSRLIEPGDLPPQDGIANLAELDKVLAVMASSQPQTQEDLYQADLNYDGKVNAIDAGAILTTLSAKSDE